MKDKQNFYHNFVIIGSTGYSKVGFYDVASLQNSRYFSRMSEGLTSKIDLIFQRLTFSEKVNKIVTGLFSKHTFSRLFPFCFVEDKPLVFIFLGQTQTLYQSGYIDYLREHFPRSKMVLYMIDLISRNKKLNFQESRNLFDIIISYDKGDCKKYGLDFWPTPYSLYPVPDSPDIEPIDVYYCGNAKMRGTLIFDTYRRCKAFGLKCKFFVTAAPEKMRIEASDIVYDHYISYVENLQYVKKAKCILEVMQANADGFTPRLWESIMYDRHLLTNNASLAASPYYIPTAMHSLDDIENIREWVDKPLSIDKANKESLSPVHLLHFIDDKLKMK